MKLLLIGSSVKDYIHIHKDSEELVKPGGLYYSALGLRGVMQDDDNAFLLSCEKYENITDRLDTGLIQEAETFDGILVNMITGFDITSGDLTDLRGKTKGLIYFDLHTLSRGINEKGKRIFRTVPDIEKWLSSVDILQLNENELLTLTDMSEAVLSESGKEAVITRALSFGVRYVALTKGEKGAEIYWIENGGLIKCTEPAVGNKLSMPVGCGDIFGAVFFYTFLKNGGNAKASLKAAVTAAGNIATERHKA